MASPGDEGFPLHKAVFDNDVGLLKRLLRDKSLDKEKQDGHSFTPLLLAARLGRQECVDALLHYGAKPDAKTSSGWHVLDEAVTCGQRPIILQVIRALHDMEDLEMFKLKPQLLAALQKLPDFYMEVKWEFCSWVPFLSRILPSDVCRFHKKGVLVRMDATLLNFAGDSRWNRGDLSYLCDCRQLDKIPVVVVDRQKKLYQSLKPHVTEQMLQETTNYRLSKDVTYSRISTKTISLEQSKRGWLWRGDRVDTVGGYQCPVYNVLGVTLVSQRRTEHLAEEDVQRLDSLRQSLQHGEDLSVADDHDGSEVDDTDRPSLPLPPLEVSWRDYICSESRGNPPIGRKPRVTEDRRSFKPVVALCSDFPIPTETVLQLLEVIAPYKHFQKFRELVKRLPPGFPMKVELPVYPTITAKVTFQSFELRNYDSDAPFRIPADFRQGKVFDVQQQ